MNYHNSASLCSGNPTDNAFVDQWSPHQPKQMLRHDHNQHCCNTITNNLFYNINQEQQKAGWSIFNDHLLGLKDDDSTDAYTAVLITMMMTMTTMMTMMPSLTVELPSHWAADSAPHCNGWHTGSHHHPPRCHHYHHHHSHRCNYDHHHRHNPIEE